MRRAVHELAFFLAIIIVVVSVPVLAVRALTLAFDTWPGDGAPEWWDRATVAAAVLFVGAALFLIWDTHRISKVEETGVIVDHLRVPARRRRRRAA
ncbi:MAG: hypothetical protein ACRD29_14890 [Acidimicrobiales bacterium]